MAPVLTIARSPIFASTTTFAPGATTMPRPRVALCETYAVGWTAFTSRTPSRSTNSRWASRWRLSPMAMIAWRIFCRLSRGNALIGPSTGRPQT
jgi:hypothetical protein